VEMSVEIIFPTQGKGAKNFDGRVALIAFGMSNFFIFIQLQTYMLNHSAFHPFPKRLVVKP
jgi:hypothetical protein